MRGGEEQDFTFRVAGSTVEAQDRPGFFDYRGQADADSLQISLKRR